jgi:hypothetical protein
VRRRWVIEEDLETGRAPDVTGPEDYRRLLPCGVDGCGRVTPRGRKRLSPNL